MDMVDVLVIGAGPAGLNAALYAARKELTVKVVTTDIGGQMLLTNEIENYLGFPSISGFELADKMEAHVKQYPVEFVYAGVKSLVKEGDGTFTAHLDDGNELRGKTCIVTAGKHSRTLDIPGEKEYTGRGVSYCATCDAPFYRKKTVAVVGGGDSAVQAAIELAKLCPTVYLLVRSRIRAQEILVKRMKELDHVKVYVGYTPEVVKGEKKVNALIIKNKADGSMEELTVDGVFVEAGGIPNNSFLPSDVKVNSLGEIMTNKDGETNVEGLFAAGDVTDCRNKQVIIAAGEGAAAALAAHEYLLRSGL
ncbi:MAG: FAD-dependent oxidoreductase [Dialister sp.]|uniref:NAD(P)/FAD-dependent oxidoreductase n=1 Tax=Dialister sp. TaxID=1955814 RepID=UPI002E7A46BA|nr:FAD-dependent oxidoreductase [Dialister sp.]MEE0292116.1 FAD-dependent oxidoreductase [Dialister sp.]